MQLALSWVPAKPARAPSWVTRPWTSRMLENSFSARLLKKVQMQGGARCAGTHRRWVGGVLSSYVAAPRGRANPPQADRWAFFSSLLEADHEIRAYAARASPLCTPGKCVRCSPAAREACVRGGRRTSLVRTSIKAVESEEVFLGPRLAAWLPEADWEWHDRVHSNLWPCELSRGRREVPTLPATTTVARREGKR